MNSSDSFSVADLFVRRVVELEAPFLPAREMLPLLTPELLDENRAWLRPLGLDQNDVFRLSYHSFIVQTPHHTILVDSCLGNDKSRNRPEWHMKSDDHYMRALAAHGLSVDDIDYVMCTHLHVDHVGWNTRSENGRWVPTFPNARYVFNEHEFRNWERTNAATPNQVFEDSVLPVVLAGQVELVGDDYELGDHVRLLPTPGHTAGHVSFCFGKKFDEVVMTGDLMHVSLQMKYPEMSFVRDQDPVMAATTRRKFFERFADTRTLCCTAHVPVNPVGRILPWCEGFRLHPIGQD